MSSNTPKSEMQCVEVEIRRELFELGVSPEEIQKQFELWLIVSLFNRGKISSARAGELLGANREAFLDTLDELGVIYIDAPHDDGGEVRTSPAVALLADDRASLADLNRELTHINRRLVEANQQIREADRLKSEFVATISHELRTPLNTIIGFAKFMLNGMAGPVNEMQRTDLTAIYSSGQHLLALVNDILDLSKIEAGKVTLDKERLDIHEITAGIISSAIALIGEKPVELREEIASDVPSIFADRHRVRQIILNLVSNAAKFTERGRIILRVKPVTENGRKYILCEVEDTGIGISPEHTAIIFEPFRQLDSSSSRRAQGTGLGLPISRRLAELHGGRLWVKSEMGTGSTFYCLLPVEDTPSTIGEKSREGLNE
jgi:signal transduction histidine kinase